MLLQPFMAIYAFAGYFLSASLCERAWAILKRDNLIEEFVIRKKWLTALPGDVPGVVWEDWGQPNLKTQQIGFVSEFTEKSLGYSVQE